MNKYPALMMTVLAVIIVLQSCSPKAPAALEGQITNVPEFITSPPADNSEFLYTTSSFVSSRRNMAHRQAALLANTNMATKLEAKIEALEKLFLEEVTAGERTNYSAGFTLATQQITSQQLTGLAEDQVVYIETAQGQIEAFILMKMPVGSARAALENALSRDEEMFVRFKESQAFRELQENLERLGIE
jgi:hypothetical protein